MQTEEQFNVPVEESGHPSPEIPSKGKFKKGPLLIGLLVLILIGGGLYAYLNLSPDSDDKPPSLEVAGSTKQGFMVTEKGNYLLTEKKDVEDFAGLDAYTDCSSIPVSNGLTYYYLSEADTAENVLKRRLVPIEGNQTLLALYSPGEAELDLTKGFHTYPEGPFSNTGELDKDFEIPPYRAFIIISKEATQGCLHGATDAPGYDSFDMQLADDEDGWIMLPVKECADVVPFADRIKSTYPLTGPNEYTEESVDSDDLADDCLGSGYQISWFKVGQATGESSDPGDDPPGDVDELEITGIEGFETPFDRAVSDELKPYAEVNAESDVTFRLYNKDEVPTEHLGGPDAMWEDAAVTYMLETVIEDVEADDEKRVDWTINNQFQDGNYLIAARAENSLETSDVVVEEVEIITGEGYGDAPEITLFMGVSDQMDLDSEWLLQPWVTTSAPADVVFIMFKEDDLPQGWENNLASVFDETLSYTFLEVIPESEHTSTQFQQFTWSFTSNTELGKYYVFVVASNDNGVSDVEYKEVELIDSSESAPSNDNGGSEQADNQNQSGSNESDNGGQTDNSDRSTDNSDKEEQKSDSNQGDGQDIMSARKEAQEALDGSRESSNSNSDSGSEENSKAKAKKFQDTYF